MRNICCYALECSLSCVLLSETFIFMYWNVAGTVCCHQKHLMFAQDCSKYCLLLSEPVVVMHLNVAYAVFGYQKQLLLCTGM
jgi:hypothetical protein